MIKTLKGKISLIYLCLVAMIAFVGLVAVINLYSLNRSVNGLLTDNYKSISAVANMLEALERQDSAVLIYINVDRQKGIELFSSNNNEFSKWYNIEYSNITEPGEEEFVKKINLYYINYIKLFSELQEIRNKDGVEMSIDYYNNTIMPDFIKIKQELKGLTSLNEKSMFKSKNIATQNSEKSMYLILIISMLAVAGGYIISHFFTNKFLKPLHSLTESIRLVKAGDLNHTINIITHDEAGELATEYNNMTRRLQQYEQSTLGKLMSEKNKSVTIVKSISDPLIVMDNNFKILMLNKACEHFFNIEEGKSLNRHFLEVILNGDLFEHISGIMEAVRDNLEKIIYINSGEGIYFNVIVTKIRDNETNVNGLIVLFHDVTHLKQLEKIRTDFIATISHEFKTPLTSIMMGTSLIENSSIGTLNERQMEIVDTMKEDGERLTTLVNDLLELSRLESERAVFKLQPCSITGIIENCVKPLYDMADRSDINLYYEADEDLPKVNADPEKISWVLNNLITNALKYTNSGDEIIVSADKRNNKMYVSVRDTGAGIPEEFIDKIFGKFVQVKGQDLEIRGTGLGLSIVKEIVKAHGGEIWCESKLDEGSNFIFTLPLSEKER